MAFGLTGLRGAAVAAALALAGGPAHAAEGVEQVVRPVAMNGVHGLAFGPDGGLYAASITGKALYRIDPKTGRVSVRVGAPEGGADDLTFSPQGDPVWTGGPTMNAIMTRTAAGGVHALAGGLPGVNAVRFSPTGRLFFTRVFGGDGLYELDPAGGRPPRVIAEGIGGLNSFDFLPDGAIVGPLFMKGAVVRIDVETGQVTTLATGFEAPSSVRRLRGALLVLNYRSGQVWRLDDATGARRLVVTVPGPADNMTVGPNGRLYVSSTANNGVTEIDLATGAARRVTWSDLSAPGLVSAAVIDGAPMVLIADDWGGRRYDLKSREVSPLHPGGNSFGMRSLVREAAGYAFVSAFSPTAVTRTDGAGKASQIDGFSRPMGLAASPRGLLVADFGAGEVVRLDPAAPGGRRVLASGLASPLGVAEAADGTVFVSEYGRGRIVRLAPGAGAGPYAQTVVGGGLKRPEGLSMAPDGRVIVADTALGQVLAIDPAGGRAVVLARGLSLGLAQARAPGAPFLATGVAVAADGFAYVPGSADNALYRIRIR